MFISSTTSIIMIIILLNGLGFRVEGLAPEGGGGSAALFKEYMRGI